MATLIATCRRGHSWSARPISRDELRMPMSCPECGDPIELNAVVPTGPNPGVPERRDRPRNPTISLGNAGLAPVPASASRGDVVAVLLVAGAVAFIVLWLFFTLAQNV